MGLGLGSADASRQWVKSRATTAALPRDASGSRALPIRDPRHAASQGSNKGFIFGLTGFRVVVFRVYIVYIGTGLMSIFVFVFFLVFALFWACGFGVVEGFCLQDWVLG